MNEPLSEDEFAEVLVRGHENGTAGVRFVQDLLVNDAGCQLGDVQHLVAVRRRLSTTDRSTLSSASRFTRMGR